MKVGVGLRAFEGAFLLVGSLPFAAAVACSAQQPGPLPTGSGGASSSSSGGSSGASQSDAGSSASAGAASSNGASANGGTNASGGTSGAAGTGAVGGTGGSSSANFGGAASAGANSTGGNAGTPSAGGGNAGSAGHGGAASGGAASGGVSSAGGSGQPAAGSGGSTVSLSCGAGKYLLCEDFESTAIGSTPQGWTRHGDQVAVSDDAAKRGSHALKLSPVASAERRIYHDAALLGAAHWGRIYYKVKQPVPDAFVHSTLVSFTGDAPQRGASEFRVVDTVKQAVDTRDVGSLHQYLYNVQVTGVSSEFSREGPYDQKFEDVWHCVEYHIDAATQSYDLYIDGKSEISFKDGAGNYGKSDIPSSFKQLRVGWVNYQQAAPGFTAWIDEVAFDDERVGCD